MAIRGSNEWTKPLDKIRDLTLKLEARQDRELDKLFADFFRSINNQSKMILAGEGTFTDKQGLIQPMLTESLEFIDDYNEFLLGAMMEHSEFGILNNQFILTKYEKRLEGVGVFAALTKGLDDIPERAFARTVATGDFPDGLRLSNRIWILKRRTRGEIKRIINDTIIQGDASSSRVMTQRLAKLLKPGRIGIRTRLHGRNVSFDAARILRTERTLAYRQADSMAVKTNGGAIGIKWNIVNDKRTTTICKNLNSQDIWGLGAGVYKIGNEPYNPHPQCRSWPTEVAVSSKQFVDSWLAGDKTPGRTIAQENLRPEPTNVIQTVNTAPGVANTIGTAP